MPSIELSVSDDRALCPDHPHAVLTHVRKRHRLALGSRTYWKAPPCHSAHVKRTLLMAQPVLSLADSGLSEASDP